ncbi:MBL fold metallo-hydrolase [Labrenzia sp. DG1229]|uniref:MBL fold metallo-hydrolase n=1 Tax=Labrenzia sp. DG1229 TaxID=681847 RepID=UPI000490AA86|nr:MBL fold metallo-hydrolase [Labrenzia sp. DG1229]
MKHDRDFNPEYGTPFEISPGIRRLTAENPGPFTFRGTNSYLLGSRRLVVVDPGPALPDHLTAILRAADGATIEAILVTHTHMDHSPGARALKNETGAPIVGCGPHRSARDLFEGEVNPLDSSGDKEHIPDRLLKDGETFSVAGFSIETIATPGHTANHLCFAIQGEEVIFSADHVMGWSTSIVAPPDGSMKDYMTSIEKMLYRSENTYFPGHGGRIHDARSYVLDLKRHRLNREASILATVSERERTIKQIVAELYAEVDPSLHPAAGLSVYAHLEDLVERGLVSASPGLSFTAGYKRTA